MVCCGIVQNHPKPHRMSKPVENFFARCHVDKLCTCYQHTHKRVVRICNYRAKFGGHVLCFVSRGTLALWDEIGDRGWGC